MFATKVTHTANLNAARRRCAELLGRLSRKLLDTRRLSDNQVKDARAAVAEFRTLGATLRALGSDAEFEPARENMTLALDTLEKSIHDMTVTRAEAQ